MKITIMFLFLLSLFVGCASQDRKNAEIYMNNRKYAMAHPLWVKVLEESPKDAEAIVAKMKCEEEIINDQLVKLRDLIISNNIADALAIAHEIRNNRIEWKAEVGYDSARFEEKEIQKLFFQFQKLVKNKIKSNKVLAAYDLMEQNKELFVKEHNKLLSKLSEDVKNKGQKKCLQFTNAAKEQHDFFSLFSNKYCKLFQGNGRAIASASDFTQNLYGGVKVKVAVKNLKPELSKLLGEKIQNKFKETVWYHPESAKEAIVTINGSFVEDVKSFKKTKVHEYTVKIPYTAHVPEMRTKQVPYQTTEYKCITTYGKNAYGGTDYSRSYQSCGNVNVTKYRSEFYWVNVPVTKYRSESRTVDYNAIEIHSYAELLINGIVGINRKKDKFSFKDHLSESDYESTISMPNIGLNPHKAQLTNHISWVEEMAGKVSEKLAENLSHNWEINYCNVNPKKVGKTAYANNVMKCMRLRGTEDEFVNNWFEQETGVSASKATKYLSFAVNDNH